MYSGTLSNCATMSIFIIESGSGVLHNDADQLRVKLAIRPVALLLIQYTYYDYSLQNTFYI